MINAIPVSDSPNAWRGCITANVGSMASAETEFIQSFCRSTQSTRTTSRQSKTRAQCNMSCAMLVKGRGRQAVNESLLLWTLTGGIVESSPAERHPRQSLEQTRIQTL